MVYNFRIAEITKQPIFETERNKHTAIALVFDQYRKKYTNVRQNYIGNLDSFIYNFNPYYFRTDFAFSHIKEQLHHVTTFSGIETDDILFTLGRDFLLNNESRVTLSGLFGIPTHKISRLQHADFGYSQVGLGLQIDGSYSFSDRNTLLYGGRYIYFVPRHALDTEKNKYDLTIGNVGDILLANKISWGKHHGFEYGYTFRSRFGAHIKPNFDNFSKKTNYLRSNFYLVYKYKFLINNISNRLLFDFSYGFDHNSKPFGTKYSMLGWISWNVSF